MYVVVGAVSGAAILGGAAAVHAAHCEDCFFTGPFVVAAVATGAVAGSLLGLIVHDALH